MKKDTKMFILLSVCVIALSICGYSIYKEPVVQMCRGQTCDKVLEDSAKCMDKLDRCREECK